MVSLTNRFTGKQCIHTATVMILYVLFTLTFAMVPVKVFRPSFSDQAAIYIGKKHIWVKSGILVSHSIFSCL